MPSVTAQGCLRLPGGREKHYLVMELPLQTAVHTYVVLSVARFLQSTGVRSIISSGVVWTGRAVNRGMKG